MSDDFEYEDPSVDPYANDGDPWWDAPEYRPARKDSAIGRIRAAGAEVRDSIAMSLQTIRSLSQASLDELAQMMENTSLMVMTQVVAIQKVQEERMRARAGGAVGY